MTQSIEKNFLIDPLTANNAIYRYWLILKLLAGKEAPIKKTEMIIPLKEM